MLLRNGTTLLHSAVLSEQLQRVAYELKCLKEQNKSLNSQNKCGRTSLLLASFSKDNSTTNIVKLLVQEEADVNISDDLKCTPLHAACQSGKLEVVEILLQAGACINAQTIKNKTCKTHYNTPLHIAVHYKNYKLVNMLLEAGADANIPNNHKEIPLFCIFRNKSFYYFDDYTIEKLISATSTTYLNSIIPSSGYTTILNEAIKMNNINLVSILIKNGVDVNFFTYNPCPIMLAAEYGYIKIVKMIWKLVDAEKCKEDFQLWQNLAFWAFRQSNERIECLYYLMKTLRVRLFPEDPNFYYLVEFLTDDNFLDADVVGITKILFELGAVFFQEDMEGLIFLCRIYHRNNCADREIELLNLLVENNVDINPWIIYFSVVNHPDLTLKLLQYCIRCDPIDVFKHILKCRRKPDVSLLNLIKDVLKLCSPYCGLRFKRFLHLQSIKNKDFPVRIYDLDPSKLKVPWHECVLDSEIDNELCEEVLDLLYRSRVPLPTLVELSRNKIRQLLRLSCKDTKSYLQNLKSLQLSRNIIDIIQCKANIIK